MFERCRSLCESVSVSHRMCSRLYPTAAHDAAPRAPGGDGCTRAAAVNTLAYVPSDIPSAQPAMAMAQAGAGVRVSAAQQGEHTVIGEGKVIAVVPGSSEIVLNHGEIKGFMDAMTMGYRD